MIKGISPGERDRYYAALEAADAGCYGGFPEAITPTSLGERLDQGNMDLLILLLCEGLLRRLDRLTVLALEGHEPLLELPQVAARLGLGKDSDCAAASSAVVRAPAPQHRRPEHA